METPDVCDLTLTLWIDVAAVARVPNLHPIARNGTETEVHRALVIIHGRVAQLVV